MSRYKSLIKYELLTILRGGYSLGFALVLPCILLALVGIGVTAEIPEEAKNAVFAGIFLGFSTLIPLAGVFLGHGANYSREYEANVPQRLNLFGIPVRKLVISKLSAQLIFVLLAFAIYFIFALILGLEFTKPLVLFSMLILLLIQSVAEFLLAHGLVGIFKKFGPTYAVTMVLYFLFMIFSGNMGIPTELLPKAGRFIGEHILPFIEYSNFNNNLLQGNSVEWQPLILTNLFFSLVALIVFGISRVKDKRAF